jgi:hypothetical protein
MHQRILTAALASFAFSVAALAADPAVGGPADAFQVNYASNLNIADSFINISNTGAVSGTDPAGRICANVYAFDPAEEMISCCSCLITPNGLNSLSNHTDVISNTLTPGVPTSIVIKLLATLPNGTTCDAGNAGIPFTAAQLAPGMLAWGTTLHQAPDGTYQVTENVFQTAVLSTTELAKLNSYCSFIQVLGSGFGICKSCQAGGLGAATK